MDRDEALDCMPAAYAVALRLEASGVDDELIAAALGLEAEGVVSLLELAHDKLSSLLRRSPA